MWTIVALFVIAIAIMLLMGVQDDIPENIRGLWDRPGLETSAPAGRGAGTNAPPPVRVRIENWSVVREGGQVELSRDLVGSWSAGTLRYDAPTLAFTCYDQRLYARLATRLDTVGTQHTTLRMDGHEQVWARAPGNVLYSPAPALLLRQLAQSDAPVRFELPTAELGERTFELDPRGLKTAGQMLPASCRAP
jgi:hypothetical protein